MAGTQDESLLEETKESLTSPMKDSNPLNDESLFSMSKDEINTGAAGAGGQKSGEKNV